MKKITIEAQVPEKKDASGTITQKQLGPVSLSVDWAESLKEAEAMFGAEALLTNALANWTVTLQSNMRAHLKKGENQLQIQTALGNSKMGVAASGSKVDPKQAYLALFATATPEEQAKLLQELKEKAAAVAASQKK